MRASAVLAGAQSAEIREPKATRREASRLCTARMICGGAGYTVSMKEWSFGTILLLCLAVVTLPLWFYFTYLEPKQCSGVWCTGAEESLSARYFFDGDKHYLRGAIIAPTPCYALTTTLLRESDEEYRVDFAAKPTTDICIERETALSFFLSFFAPQSVALTAAINEAPVPLRLIPARNLSDFESTQR